MATVETLAIVTMIVILASIVNSLGAYFLDFCLWEGNIFGGWLPWLVRKTCRYQVNGRKLSYPEYMEIGARYSFLYKMLGGCMVCTGVWIAIVTGPIIWYLSLPVVNIPWWCIFPTIFLSTFLIRMLLRIQ